MRKMGSHFKGIWKWIGHFMFQTPLNPSADHLQMLVGRLSVIILTRRWAMRSIFRRSADGFSGVLILKFLIQFQTHLNEISSFSFQLPLNLIQNLKYWQGYQQAWYLEFWNSCQECLFPIFRIEFYHWQKAQRYLKFRGLWFGLW
jgi:hypothetical protein